MEGKYIFAIVILALFFLLLFVSFAFLEYARIKDDKLQNWVNERLNNKDLSRPDYDHITADDETPIVQAEQETIAEVNAENGENVEDDPVIDDAYGKIDVEGIEEITGNYNGK